MLLQEPHICKAYAHSPPSIRKAFISYDDFSYELSLFYIIRNATSKDKSWMHKEVLQHKFQKQSFCLTEGKKVQLSQNSLEEPKGQLYHLTMMQEVKVLRKHSVLD